MKQKFLTNAADFITRVPHFSLVWGDENVAYLKKRYELMHSAPLFKGMEYPEYPNKLNEWFPIVMRGRKKNQPIAATRMEIGTDVNFGALTRGMIDYLKEKPGVSVHFNHEAITVD